MQASIADDISWRVGLYRQIFAFCEQGQFSLARFLALVPDRLRLTAAESIAKAQIPVLLEVGFLERCAELLAELDSRQAADAAAVVRAGGRSRLEQMRRAIRLAQIHGNLDVLRISRWLAARGRAFLTSAGELYLKGLREVGRGEGGEEAVYLAHLLVLHAFRKAMQRARMDQPQYQALVQALLAMALQGALSAEALAHEGLSARLGLQCAVTGSPFALGGTAGALLASPLNSYRTSAEAVELARRRMSSRVEEMDIESTVSSVQAPLISGDAARQRLASQQLHELVRDCLLLSTAKLGDRKPSRLLNAFHRLASSTELLSRCLADATQRQQLIALIDAEPGPAEQPLPTLRMLVSKPDSKALDADLPRCARLAASGAVLFVLDEKVSRLAEELIARVHFLDADQGGSAYRRGRCYRLAFDDKPLYELPERREEAHLFVDVKDFTRRTATIKEQAMGDFLKRYFYEPIFDLAANLQGNSPDALSVINILGDAVAFRGEITPIVSLALGIRRILAQAARELTASLPDLLGGSAGTDEIDEEIATVEAEVRRLEAQLEGALPMLGTGPSAPAERRKRLLAQRAMLEQARSERRARGVGHGLEAGAYISFGAAAERLDLSHAALGPWSVCIGERLNEAARGTARSSVVKAQRDAELARLRSERQSPDLHSPFQVLAGANRRLQISARHAESLEQAIHHSDKNAVTGAVRQLGAWLHQLSCEAIDRNEGNLPACFERSEELYNGGCALSGAALEAFEKANRGKLVFVRRELYQRQLPPDFHRKYWLEFDPERFVLAREAASGAATHLWRYTGKARFRGFEAEGGIDVWELVLPESAFGVELLAAVAAEHRVRRPVAGEQPR